MEDRRRACPADGPLAVEQPGRLFALTGGMPVFRVGKRMGPGASEALGKSASLDYINVT